ncbi:MAG: hypothetical protein HY368_00145 [Candidatus Aenigmarchaeota archaeon]|nr:hypothetical protein [Candidatus Aenigmarchaeota archaeon]
MKRPRPAESKIELADYYRKEIERLENEVTRREKLPVPKRKHKKRG